MLDLGKISEENQVNLSDHCPGRLSDSYASYGFRARRTAENYAAFRTWSGPLATERTEDEDDESRFCSPPLWRTSPTSSPPHRKNHYRSLSPASKAQAIARGQRELMEMVSKMPESCYELSLKDLVEQQTVMEARQESFREEHKEVKLEKGFKRNERRVEIMRKNASQRKNNEGFLLKMVLPVGFGPTKKKKKKNDTTSSKSNSSRIIPKSPIPEGSDNNKAVDKEWWRKRFSVQEETESSGGSSSSNHGSGKSSVSTNSSGSLSRNSSRYVFGNRFCIKTTA